MLHYENSRGSRCWRRKRNDLRSAQLGWVIPPGGSRLGPPEERGEATELAEMIFTGGGRPGARVCCRWLLPEGTTACAWKPFGICLACGIWHLAHQASFMCARVCACGVRAQHQAC